MAAHDQEAGPAEPDEGRAVQLVRTAGLGGSRPRLAFHAGRAGTGLTGHRRDFGGSPGSIVGSPRDLGRNVSTAEPKGQAEREGQSGDKPSEQCGDEFGGEPEGES